MGTLREVNESPVYQGSNETISYAIDFADWGTPSSPACTLWQGTTNVTSTNLSGSASVTGDIVTTPAVKTLTAGSEYVMKCVVTISGNTESCWLVIRCDPY